MWQSVPQDWTDRAAHTNMSVGLFLLGRLLWDEGCSGVIVSGSVFRPYVWKLGDGGKCLRNVGSQRSMGTYCCLPCTASCALCELH